MLAVTGDAAVWEVMTPPAATGPHGCPEVGLQAGISGPCDQLYYS